MNKKIYGFTLIEMLVVISIIALLAGFMVTAINAARRRAKYVRAVGEVGDLAKAWKAYWVTYKKWPDGVGDSTLEMSATVMHHLQGNNAQKLNFMDANHNAEYKDPWGHPYSVTFNSTEINRLDYFETSVYFANRRRYEYDTP